MTTPRTVVASSTSSKVKPLARMAFICRVRFLIQNSPHGVVPGFILVEPNSQVNRLEQTLSPLDSGLVFCKFVHFRFPGKMGVFLTEISFAASQLLIVLKTELR